MMRRLPRSPEKFEVLDLFTSLGLTHGFTLIDGRGHGDFVQLVERSFNAAVRNPIILHGRRVQSMFSYVVASLGRVQMIKEEDAGETLVTDPDSIRVPDFLLVLDDGNSFLVEVKNHRNPHKPMALKGSYLASLEKYARLVGRPVRVAIYWSPMNIWTLVSLPHLPRHGGTDVRIDLPTAIKRNEMADLGDMQVATTPPLMLRVLTDPTKPRSVDVRGEVQFTIGDIVLYCAGTRIESREERNLAYYFMHYSNWTGGEPTACIEGNALIHLDFEVAHPMPVAGQEFEMLGPLSSMISRRFNDLTAPSGSIERIAPSTDPGALGVVIPPDYRGQQLHLWRFVLRPNYE